MFTTSTLAVGANLPAFLVIIKGTQQYDSGARVSPKLLCPSRAILSHTYESRFSCLSPKRVKNRPKQLHFKVWSIVNPQLLQCYREYDAASIQQMAGRAGRPDFDDEGRVIVLTQQSTAALYSDILASKKPIESTMHKTLVEHVNSEVVLGTIKDIPSVLDWAQSTLLWIRAKERPSFYFPEAVSKEDDASTARMKVFAVSVV